MYHHINSLLIILCYSLIISWLFESDSNRKLILLVVGLVGIYVYPIMMELLINIQAKLFKREDIKSHDTKHSKIYKSKIPICYSEGYNITACGLEKLHPFDSCKYRNGT